MPRKRVEKADRIAEDPKQLPTKLQQKMVERLWRIGWSAKQIVELGFASSTAYANIKRYKETGTTDSRARSGRPCTAYTRRNVNKVWARWWMIS